MNWIEEYKHRLYMMMLCSGLATAILVWAINNYAGNLTMFTRSLLVGAMISLSVLICLVSVRRVSVTVVQEIMYVLFGGVLLSVLFYALYGGLSESLEIVALFSVYLFLPFLYIFIFLAYEERGALIRSAVIYVASVAISLPALFDGTDNGLLVVPSAILVSYLAAAMIIGQLYMLSRMKQSLESAEELTKIDPLTSVLNRRGFHEIMDQRIEEALQENKALSIVVFDLDDFKRLNDTLGHDIGDEALISVARAVGSELREDDAIARWGGEEFAILCPGSDAKEAYLVAERLRATVERCDLSMDWKLTASFGISSLLLGTSKEDLTKQADLALYIAKGDGKNCTRIYGSDTEATSKRVS